MKFVDGLTHTGLCTAKGALEGVLWGGAAIAAVALLGIVAVPLAPFTGGASLLLTGAAGLASWAFAGQALMCGAAIFGGFGLLKGLATLPKVEAEQIGMETRKNAEMQRNLAFQERQQIINAGMAAAQPVRSQPYLPGQQQGYAPAIMGA